MDFDTVYFRNMVGDYFNLLTSGQPNPFLYAKQIVGETLIYKYNNSVGCFATILACIKKASLPVLLDISYYYFF